MSTKIYDAYKVKDMGVDELFVWLCKFRKKYIARCSDYLGGFITNPNEYYKVSDAARKAMASGLNDPLNVKSSIIVIPFKDELYVKTLIDRAIYPKNPLPTKYFEDFHYQNQSDWPKGMAAKEWNHRRDVWNAIMKRAGGDTFAEIGLTFPLVDESNIFLVCCKIYERSKQCLTTK